MEDVKKKVGAQKAPVDSKQHYIYGVDSMSKIEPPSLGGPGSSDFKPIDPSRSHASYASRIERKYVEKQREKENGLSVQ